MYDSLPLRLMINLHKNTLSKTYIKLLDDISHLISSNLDYSKCVRPKNFPTDIKVVPFHLDGIKENHTFYLYFVKHDIQITIIYLQCYYIANYPATFNYKDLYECLKQLYVYMNGK